MPKSFEQKPEESDAESREELVVNKIYQCTHPIFHAGEKALAALFAFFSIY